MAIVNLNRVIGKKMATEGRNITIKEISEATGISENRLIEYRKGKAKAIGLDTIEILCAYFVCRVDELIGLESGKGHLLIKDRGER